MKNVIHVCFGPSATGLLRYTLSNKRNHEYFGEVISVDHDFSVGSINGLKTESGRLAANAIALIEEISKDSKVVLWFGQNVIEKTGVCCVANHIKTKDLFKVEIPEEFQDINCESMEIKAVAEIDPENLWNVFEKNITKVSNEELEYWIKCWEKLIQENENLRILKNNQIISVAEDYYDLLILNFIDKEWKSAARIIGDTLGYGEQVVSDSYIEYRLKQLIRNKLVEYKGDLTLMRDYWVRTI